MSDSKPVNLNLPDPALYVAFNSDNTAIRFWTCDHLRALNAEMAENLPILEFYSRDHIVRYGSDRHDAGRSAVVCDWHQDTIEQLQGEHAFGEPLSTAQLRDALRNLRHVDSHLIEAHVSALVARWPAFDLATYLHQFRIASEYACGPGLNTGHLAESCLTRLKRALHTPDLQRNWLDLITFGIDGAQRAGATQADIIAYLEHMLTRFRNRAADLSARDPYEQTDHTARHTDVANREV